MQHGEQLENDPLLIQEFREGKDEALRKLLEMFHTGLLLFATKLINKQDGEEIVSDIFMKLFKLNTDFESLKNIKAFLYISTRNACFDRIRKNTSQKNSGRVISLSENEEEAYNSHEQIPDDPEYYSLQTDLIIRIRERVETLPEECRKIFKMRYYEGMRPTDIARKLGISKATVSKQIGIAIIKLRAPLFFYGLFLLIKSAFSNLLQ